MDIDPNIKQSVPKWFWQAIGILVIVFLALAVLEKFHVVANDFKSQKPDNTISISADGKVNAVPDQATISLGVLTNASTAKQAQDDNAKKVNAVIDFVKKQGIDAKNITTTQLNVYPQYDYTNGRNVINGYSANQTISVKIHGIDKSTDQVGLIIDGATGAGANEVQGVNLDFENPDNLREQARELAIDNAKQKAQQLADKAGLKLGRIVSISESSSSVPYPIPYALDMAGKGGGVASTAPEIQAGSQDITASMTIVFEVR